MRSLAIIGASGHGKVVADIASLLGYERICFLDDNSAEKAVLGFPVVGTTADVEHTGGDIFVAIGNPAVRKELMQRFQDRQFPVLVHPSAVVADSACVGEGTVIMAGAVVNPDSTIGRGAIINTCASVDHDCELGDFTHVAVGAHLCGTVRLGEAVWIGAGATVINNLSVCDATLVGAGAVVAQNIELPGTYVGVPAKPMKRLD